MAYLHLEDTVDLLLLLGQLRVWHLLQSIADQVEQLRVERDEVSLTLLRESRSEMAG
jgi:hypothetical protein